MMTYRCLFLFIPAVFWAISAFNLSPSSTRILQLEQSPPPVVAQDLTKQFNEIITRLIQLKSGLPRIGADDFDSPLQRNATIDSIDDMLQTLDFIRQDLGANNLRLPDEVLDQLNASAEVLASILEKLNGPTPHLVHDDQKRLELLQKDLHLKISNINEIRGNPSDQSVYPECVVIVSTVTSDGKEQSQLTIYYVPQAIHGTPRERDHIKSFRLPSSPTQQTLPEADYYVWAGTAQSPDALTNVKDLEARKRSGNQLTVTLKPGK
jgi:hypothetical protein